MKEFKGTPGPWFTGESRRDLINVKHSSNRPGAMSLNLAHVVARQSCVEEAKANAHLIAAAPELLEALQTLNQAIDYGTSMDVVQAQEVAQDVIAKALGENK